MPTQANYDAVQAAIQQWVNKNEGFYASMVPPGTVAAIAKVAVDADQAYLAENNSHPGAKS